MSNYTGLEAEAAVCHECGEWRRECSCDPQCEQQDKPLWPDMAESDYDA